MMRDSFFFFSLSLSLSLNGVGLTVSPGRCLLAGRCRVQSLEPSWRFCDTVGDGKEGDCG